MLRRASPAVSGILHGSQALSRGDCEISVKDEILFFGSVSSTRLLSVADAPEAVAHDLGWKRAPNARVIRLPCS